MTAFLKAVFAAVAADSAEEQKIIVERAIVKEFALFYSSHMIYLLNK